MDDLLAELDRRAAPVGYATTWEELEAGLCSTAAPVRGSRGTVIAAISVSAPTVRTSHERLAELSAQVVEEADALSEHISCLATEENEEHERTTRSCRGSTTTRSSATSPRSSS